jgi:hypothetical protein
LEVSQHAEEIAGKLAGEEGQANYVIRGYLALTILTGDIQYLLDAIKRCLACTEDNIIDVADLLALMIQLAKEFYQGNAKKCPKAVSDIDATK